MGICNHDNAGVSDVIDQSSKISTCTRSFFIKTKPYEVQKHYAKSELCHVPISATVRARYNSRDFEGLAVPY